MGWGGSGGACPDLIALSSPSSIAWCIRREGREKSFAPPVTLMMTLGSGSLATTHWRGIQLGQAKGWGKAPCMAPPVLFHEDSQARRRGLDRDIYPRHRAVSVLQENNTTAHGFAGVVNEQAGTEQAV